MIHLTSFESYAFSWIGVETVLSKLHELQMGKKAIGYPKKTKKQSPIEVGTLARQAERTGTCYRVEITNRIND